MSKYILSLVAVLVCVASSARADEGISANTLSEMGLSGMTVISDNDALAIRGLGFTGGCNSCVPRAKKQPWSAVVGNSFATISVEGCPDCVIGGSHSENAYAAEGPYAASGDNYSEAGASLTKVEIVDIDGVMKSLTTINSTKVWAGGRSSAMSF